MLVREHLGHAAVEGESAMDLARRLGSIRWEARIATLLDDIRDRILGAGR